MPAFAPGVNSYVEQSYADAYFEDERPSDIWLEEASDENRQAALMYATEWLNGTFSWRGSIEDQTSQSLAWPRVSARDHEGRLLTSDHPLVDTDGIPFAVKNACCEAALVHLQSAFNEVRARGGDVKLVKVGPITREFFEGAPGGPTLPHIKRMLRGTIRGNSFTKTWSRR